MRKNPVMFNIIRRAFLLFLIPFAAVAQVAPQNPSFASAPFDTGIQTAMFSGFILQPEPGNYLRFNVAQLNAPNSGRSYAGRRDTIVASSATTRLAQSADMAYPSTGSVREKISGVDLLSFVGTPAWIEHDAPLQAGSYKISLQAVAMPGCSAAEIKIIVNGMPLGTTFSPSDEVANYTSSESFDVAVESVNVVRIESRDDSDGCVVNIDDLKFILQAPNVTGGLNINTPKTGGVKGLATASTAPGAPTIGTAIRGNASATVPFTAPTSDGGSAITTYTATSTPGTLTKTCVAPCSSITVTGLTNGTAYTFKVKATNAIGTGSSSAASNSVTPLATLPGVPTIGTATAGNAQATVTFAAPASNGGSAITSYTATSQFGSKIGMCTAPCTSITVTGLSNGTAYKFTVKATNVNGASAASVASNSVTPATFPGAPIIGTATAGNASATVAFTVPASDGGSAITSYTATSVVGGKTGTCTAPCTTISVTGLTNGTAYTFTVKATNAIGSSAASAASNSVTPVAAPTVPGAPTIGTATAGNASATIAFTAPASNGGSAITSHTATSVVGAKTGTCTAPCTSISVTGLTNGTAYTFTVKATNAIGSGAASAASNSVTPNIAATAPGAPAIGTATAGNASATVAFTAPASNGGSAITSYTATSVVGAKTGTCTAPCTSISVTGLTNGTAYSFTVKATNAIGGSAASAASNSVTPAAAPTVPGAPTIGIATAGNTSATITFTAPASNGGSAITSYTTTSTPSGPIGTCTAPCTSITVAGLTNGTAYTFSVKAINAIGTGAASTASNSVTPNVPATVPDAPTIGAASIAPAPITVTFAAPANNGGSAIISYIATSTPGGVTGSCAAPCSSIIVGGLAAGTAYTFYVSATNAVGTSAPSAISNSVTAVLSSQTITDFSPPTPVLFSDGYLTLTATGGASGNAIVFASTTSGTCLMANIATVQLIRVGTCTLTANQAGNAAYRAAAQITRNVVINKADQAITFAPLADVVLPSGLIGLSAYTSASGLTVTFTSGTPSACAVSGSTVLPLNAGICRVLADQSATGTEPQAINYNPAPQVSRSFTISNGPRVQSITGFSPASPVSLIPGGTFSISATGGVTGNPVTFGSASSAVCSVAGNIVTMNATGTCVLTADQAGNASYDAARQALANVVIEQSATSPTAARLITPALTAAIRGQPYSGRLVVSSTPNVSSVTATGLPPGLTASHNGTGTVTLSGTPTASGDFALLISASSAAGNVSFSTTLTVNEFVTTIESLSAGGSHSCVAFGGGVRCWGDNGTGQLGNGTMTSTAAAIVAISPNSGATSVSAGLSHSCAVVNGGVQCWGSNSSGQLGDSTLVQRLVPTVVIAAASSATAVSAGGAHTCAVVNGGVRCWGRNQSGQLGNGSMTSSVVPVIAIADGSGVTAIAAGSSHTCAIAEGGVQCWGSNSSNALNLNNFSIQSSAVPIIAIAAGSGVTAISAGSSPSIGVSQTCVVIDGGVECWGSNNQGKLGGFSTSTQIRYAISGGSGATAVAAGGEHTCAVVDGGVKCWGKNDVGQLGAGFSTNNACCQGDVFDAVRAGSNVTAISAGQDHTCAIINGFVECWGDGLFDTVGRRGNITQTTYPTPIQSIPTGSNVSSVTIGGFQTCGVMNGALQCWGRAGSFSNPTYGTISQFSPGQTVAAAAGGQNHLCAIIDGGILCRGDNTYGQFGNNSTQAADQPASLALGSRVGGIAVGRQHTCALVNGGVQCWGGNSSGQLGNNSTTGSLVPVMTTAAGAGATAIAAAGLHSCAIINGGVQCWGSNGVGQLGNNSVISSLVPVMTIATASGATAVAAGDSHTCAVVNGGVWCWGDNTSGQLGIGSTSAKLVPTQVMPMGSNATAIAAGVNHTCAVISGGVQCWGNNFVGQLGNSTTVSSFVPVTAIPFGSNVISIAVGGGYFSDDPGHSCAVLNGGVLCWGSNTRGDLAFPVVGPNDKVLATITNILPPSAPTITATAFDSTSLTLTFAPPANNGGGVFTAYRAICIPPSNVAVVSNAPADAASITMGGLTTNVTYACTVSAANIIGYGPASNIVSIKPISPATPPTVALILPPGFESGKLAQGPIINLGVSAQANVGTLTLLELFDGTTLLTSFTPPAGSTSYISPTYAWTNASLGIHTLTVKATNSQGTTKSVPTGVEVFVPSTITLSTTSNFFFAPATIALASVATPAPGTTVFRLEIFAHNGVTNTKIHSNISGNFPPPYNFSWLNVAAGNYALTTVISDRQGLVITSAPVNITVVNNVSIQIATPLNGSTVSGDTVLVSGTTITPSNSAVSINGQLATLTTSGQFFINDLPLTAGANTITATVTAPDGQTANQVITVNRSTTLPLFAVTVGQGGIVVPGIPALVDVTVLYPNGTQSGTTPFGEIVIECASPGGSVLFALTLGTYQCTYAEPGTYDVKVTVKDSVNVAIFTATKRVTVEAPKDRFSLLTGIYNGVNTRLKAGNIDGAMNNFTNTIRENYRAAFTAAGAGLGAMVDGFGTIKSLRLNGGFAELIIVRNTVDGEVVFSVFMLQDSDGIWRIDGF